MTRLLVLASLFLLSACDAAPNEHGEVEATAVHGAGLQREFAGSPLPQETVLAPDGTEIALADIAPGEPLLINLWATWCAPCIRELPTLVALSGREGAPHVLTLNQDMGPQTSVRAFLDDKGLVGVEAWQDPAMAMIDVLQVQIMPTTVLYDAEGNEVWRYVGDLDWTGEEAAALLADVD